MQKQLNRLRCRLGADSGGQNHVLNRGSAPPHKGTILGVSGTLKRLGSLAAVHAKTAELIKMTAVRGDSCGSKEPCIRWGENPPRKKAVIGGFPAHLKAL